MGGYTGLEDLRDGVHKRSQITIIQDSHVHNDHDSCQDGDLISKLLPIRMPLVKPDIDAAHLLPSTPDRMLHRNQGSV